MNFKRDLKKRRFAGAIDITPLIDVVFNLLIFLLVSTTFKNQEQAFSIVLPVGDQPSQVTRVERPTVFVNSQGKYYLYAPGQDRSTPVLPGSAMSLAEVSQKLKAMSAAKELQSGLSIQADRATDFQQVVNVVNECKRHGIDKVFFPYRQEPTPATP